MCCIHFSNKGGKKKRLWGEWRGVREARVLCLHPHSDLSDRHTLLPPLQHPAACRASVSCVLPAHSQRFPMRVYHVCRNEERQQRNNNCIEIENRRVAKMLEICHLCRNRKVVGSRGGMKKGFLQPGTPGERGRFHLQGARLIWHEILLHTSKPVKVLWSGFEDFWPHVWTLPHLSSKSVLERFAPSCSSECYCSRISSFLQVSVCSPWKRSSPRRRAAFCRGTNQTCFRAASEFQPAPQMKPDKKQLHCAIFSTNNVTVGKPKRKSTAEICCIFYLSLRI